MSRTKEEKRLKDDGEGKKSKKDQKDKKDRKDRKQTDAVGKDQGKTFTLLADEKTTNAALSSLFAAKVCVTAILDMPFHTYLICSSLRHPNPNH